MSILWIYGVYSETIISGYGAGERSLNLSNIFSMITGSNVINIVLKRPFKKQKTMRKDYEYLELSLWSKAGRLITKPLRVLSGKRSPLKIIFLTPSRTYLIKILKNINHNDIVVLDALEGYLSIRPIFNKLYNKANMIVYLSHNYEIDYYTHMRNWVFKKEKEIVNKSDLIIAASQRDAQRYELDMGADCEKIVVFPNVFPVKFREQVKLQDKTVAIVAGAAYKVINKIVLKLLKYNIINTLIYIGKKPPFKLQKDKARIKINNTEIIYRHFIKERKEYLSFISQAHIGINYCEWLGGSNVKRYDYALGGLTIFSGGTGFRGDHLPGEIPFLDIYDLLGKIKNLTKDECIELGNKNREKVHKLYYNSLNILKQKLK